MIGPKTKAAIEAGPALLDASGFCKEETWEESVIRIAQIAVQEERERVMHYEVTGPIHVVCKCDMCKEQINAAGRIVLGIISFTPY